MAAPSPNKRRRRHHRPFFLSSPTTPRRLLSLAASTLLLLCCCFSPFHRGVGVEAKEIVATSEWTLLGENDTIPAGLHVRMDMTTGEKWVKLMDDEEDGKDGEEKETHWSNSKDRLKGQGTVDVEVGADGATVYSSAVSVTPTDTEDMTKETVKQDEPKLEQQQQQHTEPKEVEYDYEMMHRTLSSLPPDEKERMGGLPELPAADPMSAKVTPEQRVLFEERMKEIWTQRQMELKEWQENYMADLPEVLKERIKVLESYVQNPTVHIQNLLSSEGGRNDANEEEEGGDAAVATDIVSVLQDLEYHLSDVDMARDFHTLGGWTLLVSLLSDSVHVPPMIDKQQNETADIGLNERSKMDIIQANAAWAIGTAVKNHDEFHSWSLEDYSDALVTTSTEDGETVNKPPAVTAITLLVDHFRTIVVDDAVASATPSQTDITTPKTTAEAWNKRQKYLYALGSILRGNRLAQRHFLDVNGPSVLANLLSNFAQPQSGAGALTRQEQKFISKTLALADDVITDVTLHPSTTTADDERTFDSAIVNSFTTKVWSNAVLHLLITNNNKNRVVREATLRTILAMVPYCDTCWEDIDFTKKAVIQARNNVGMDEEMDMEHKIEVLEIANSILKGLA